MCRRLRALLEDETGAYDLIQFALIVPIFVIILYGSFELMKLISIRQSLDSGTYQAARYLSVYHKFYYDSQYNRGNVDDTLRAERLIWESLQANSFIYEDTPLQVVVRYFNGAGEEIPSPVDFPCWDIRNSLNHPDTSNLVFTVRTQLTLPWQTSVLGLSMGSITLTSAHTSFVDCGPWYPWPRPTPTPTSAAGG
jgi:hypothetical protein